MTDSDIAPQPARTAPRGVDRAHRTTAAAPPARISGTSRRQARPAFPELEPARTAAHAPTPGQAPLWTAGLWTASPLMRSLVTGIGVAVIGACLTFWLFHNIWLAIAAYAVFGAIGILLTALR